MPTGLYSQDQVFEVSRVVAADQFEGCLQVLPLDANQGVTGQC